MKTQNGDSSRFDLHQLARSFPEHAESLLLDRYLVDGKDSSARIFRVYRGAPAHYHVGSDEHLFVLSGRGNLWVEDPGNGGEFGPGSFFFFRKSVVHALPDILESPVVFLAIDVPRRDPSDVVFVDSPDSSPQTFIRRMGEI